MTPDQLPFAQDPDQPSPLSAPGCFPIPVTASDMLPAELGHTNFRRFLRESFERDPLCDPSPERFRREIDFLLKNPEQFEIRFLNELVGYFDPNEEVQYCFEGNSFPLRALQGIREKMAAN